MKCIKLSSNKYAKVSDEDFCVLSKYPWYLSGRYARRSGYKKGEQLSMHREILNAPEDWLVDHINGDPLDNRRENLRLAKYYENSSNRIMDKRNKTGYKGVVWHKRDKKFQASIRHKGRGMHLGYFDEAEDAARAYNEAASKYHGKFANLNIL